MSWVLSSGPKETTAQLRETYTLPASATTEYSTVIRELRPLINKNNGTNNRYITVAFNASAVTGTNLDIALYGADDLAGTNKFLLKDAIVADITATGWTAGQIDLNAYPANYYFIAWTSDINESANTIDVRVVG